MGNKTKGRGTPPSPNTNTLPAPKQSHSDGYPVLCLRLLRSGYGVEELTDKQRSEFLIKWAKRAAFTWTELVQHSKHGLGSEQMPSHKIKKSAPEAIAQDNYMVMRHEGNLPIVGFKAGDTFYPLWIEAKYGDIYKH